LALFEIEATDEFQVQRKQKIQNEEFSAKIRLTSKCALFQRENALLK